MHCYARALTKEQTYISIFPEQKHILRGFVDVYRSNLLQMAGRLINATFYDGHPNLIQLRSVEPIKDGMLRLTHTYQQGQNLQGFYEQSTNINGGIQYQTIDLMPDDLMKEVSKLCEGVSHLHDREIIHRDISPNNILLSPHDELILFDYETAGVPLVPDLIWEHGIGTIGFASPEQYPDFEIDINTNQSLFINTQQLPGFCEPRIRPVTSKTSDIFSLGATITEIFYREILRRKYPGPFIIDYGFKKNLINLFTPHEFFASDVGRTLIKAQELNSHNRFQSVAEFEETLRNAVTNQLGKRFANRFS